MKLVFFALAIKPNLTSDFTNATYINFNDDELMEAHPTPTAYSTTLW